MLEILIRGDYNATISHNRIHRYLLGRGLAKSEVSKRKQRKWIRYERKHSMSAGHIDWHDDDSSGLKICTVLNADLALGVPSEDEDILLHLVDKGILTPEMLDKIHGMRGFRNIVVHRYGNMDDALAFHLLKENIGDFFCVQCGN